MASDTIKKLPTLLFVDDDQVLLAAVNRLFHARGYAVSTTSCASQALELLASEPVDFVISDLNMPEVDGYELLRRIRLNKELDHIHVVAATGDITPSLDERLAAAGFKGLLEKPYWCEDVESLLSKISQAENLGFYEAK